MTNRLAEIPQFSDFEHHGENATEAWADALVKYSQELQARLAACEKAYHDQLAAVMKDLAACEQERDEAAGAGYQAHADAVEQLHCAEKAEARLAKAEEVLQQIKNARTPEYIEEIIDDYFAGIAETPK